MEVLLKEEAESMLFSPLPLCLPKRRSFIYAAKKTTKPNQTKSLALLFQMRPLLKIILDIALLIYSIQ